MNKVEHFQLNNFFYVFLEEPELEIYDATNEEVPVDEQFSDGENSFDSFSSGMLKMF